MTKLNDDGTITGKHLGSHSKVTQVFRVAAQTIMFWKQ